MSSFVLTGFLCLLLAVMGVLFSWAFLRNESQISKIFNIDLLISENIDLRCFMTRLLLTFLCVDINVGPMWLTICLIH